MLSFRSAAMFVVVSLCACGEEEPGVLVNDNIAWQLGCESSTVSCTTFRGHSQASATRPEAKFKVTCEKASSGLNIRITDPGDYAMGIPQSVLSVTALDVESCDCTVTVTERSSVDGPEFTFTGTCAAGDCELGGADAAGWNYNGTLKCTNLTDPTNAATAPHTLQKPDQTPGQVVAIDLAVDNC